MQTRATLQDFVTGERPQTPSLEQLRGRMRQEVYLVKIVEVSTVVVGTPWRELTFVELVTDEGLRGVGEARMLNKTDTLLACIDELAGRYVVGADPFDTERLAWRFSWEEYGRAGEVTQSALACIDQACYDLMGQALGVPVWRLLGGAFRDRVPAYANGWYQGDRRPESFAAMAGRVVTRGYRGLKVDPFGAATAELDHRQLSLAVDIIAAVRDAVGSDVALMVEMHGRFTAATAVVAARALEPYRPEWIEEPVPPYHASALRRVRAGTTLPIATGERVHEMAEFREMFEHGTVDIVQADLTHFGGLTGIRKLAGWADAYGLLMAPHTTSDSAAGSKGGGIRRPSTLERNGSTRTVTAPWVRRKPAWPSHVRVTPSIR